jgi:very-short-patch-repair endonuclease/biotin operon repressor
LEIISKEFNGFNVRIVLSNGTELFIAKDIAELLKYKRPAKAVNDNCKNVINLNEILNSSIQRLFEKSDIEYFRKTFGTRWANTQFIKESDVWRLIHKSQKVTEQEKKNIVNFFDFTKTEIFTSRQEIEFGKELKNFIKTIYNLEVQTQYFVKNYKLDFYIPELNLAIEFDEKHHKYQKEEDKKRANEIKNILNCKFVRVSEEQSIGEQLGLVMKAINEEPKKEISLSKRQKQILEYLQNQKLSTKELSKKLGFSKSTILKDLKFLIENEQIEKVKSGRNVFYKA